uniref:Bifunctional polymyxin resistance protein ArnA n=1 Tax=Zeugodacus cucurbitae TaxID=28588 RepID=A0A0A1WUU4_ZEUCU
MLGRQFGDISHTSNKNQDGSEYGVYGELRRRKNGGNCEIHTEYIWMYVKTCEANYSKKRNVKQFHYNNNKLRIAKFNSATVVGMLSLALNNTELTYICVCICKYVFFLLVVASVRPIQAICNTTTTNYLLRHKFETWRRYAATWYAAIPIDHLRWIHMYIRNNALV